MESSRTELSPLPFHTIQPATWLHLRILSFAEQSKIYPLLAATSKPQKGFPLDESILKNLNAHLFLFVSFL